MDDAITQGIVDALSWDTDTITQELLMSHYTGLCGCLVGVDNDAITQEINFIAASTD